MRVLGKGELRMGNRGMGRGGFSTELRGGFSDGFRGPCRGHGSMTGRCHYYNKKGHWKNECYKRKREVQRNLRVGQLAFIGVTGQQN